MLYLTNMLVTKNHLSSFRAVYEMVLLHGGFDLQLASVEGPKPYNLKIPLSNFG